MTSRRDLLKAGGAASALLLGSSRLFSKSFTEVEIASQPPLQEFGYGDVSLAPGRTQAQFEQTRSVLLGLDEDSLLKPWRLRAGLPAPGAEMGGWYDEVPKGNEPTIDHGFAPAHPFGQWISALSRGYAVDRDPATKAKLQRLLDLYEPAISGKFYTNFRFPAYVFDKMVIGLIDAHRFGGIEKAFSLLDRTTDAALPHLPPKALDRDSVQKKWRESIGEDTSDDYTWDESYTLAENLYLAAKRGAGERYRTMAPKYLLDETYFDPLSEGKNVLAGHHAYSFCNALSSAMQAYLEGGSEKHLRAATNAFEMIVTTQSYATGGWGPDESFREPHRGALYDSLTKTKHSFETPCGSYAHFKLSRALLRVTRDGKYGDSMERVLYNTVLGAKPLERDGRAFYYSDFSNSGSKFFHDDKWPCCSGTLPQVAADYRILTYFQDPEGVYVNLYLPSTLKWTTKDGAQLSLTQSGGYPLDGNISFAVHASRKADFALRLRIPAWAEGPVSVTVNGSPAKTSVNKGFATVQRRWKNGDRLELMLPMPTRLESIEPEHPDTVALLRGPLVLFPLTTESPKITRAQLLQASHVEGKSEWTADSDAGPLRLKPYTEIEDEHYRTYLNVS